MLEIVDFRDYRAFCFRGEGRCNLVISAKSRRDDIRIVWRLAKKRKSGLINYKPKGRLINTYIEQFISPFLDNDYLIKAKLVHINTAELHYLAKIPYLPHNLKVEDFHELSDITNFPPENSRFPNKNYGIPLVCALEMPDATRIPRQLDYVYGPTITLEIKPKQGFFQTHPGIDLPFCNNCILQIEKWKSADFTSMYDFCPLSLYSGDRVRMCDALHSLICDPHRNLRIFMDGNAIHDEFATLNPDELVKMLFPTISNANIQTYITAISCILSGITDDQIIDFHLVEGSVLHALLKAQQTDTIGIVRAYELYKKLPQSVQRELRKNSNLLSRARGLGFLDKSDPRSLVERYLLAATMKDCSLMISIRLIDKLGITDSMIMATGGGDGYIRVRGLDGRTLYFAYSIRIVDLDPKSAKNLENAYNRFMAGVSVIKVNPNIHPPCVGVGTTY